MKVFAISDLHLAFADTVDKPMDKFGPAWENHAARLSASWSKLVSEDDLVIVPGDISWGMSLEEAKPDLAFVDSLPGKKVMLRGNHDFWWSSMKKMRGLYGSIEFIQNDAVVCGDFVICGSRGWNLPWNVPKEMTAEENEKIYKREILRMEMSLRAALGVRDDRMLIAAVHFPPFDPSHHDTEFTELFKDYGVNKVVYGHLHGKRISEAVEGVFDGIEYRLVSLDKLDAMPCTIV